MKLSDKKQITLLMVLGWMVYFSSYITRINFGAVLVEFIAAENVTKSAASLITSVLFVTYGAGQLLSGYLGDRISPRLLIFTGLTVAVGSNILMPLCSPHIPVMAVIWGINGIAQAFMWPPLVKILSCALTPEDYSRLIPGIGTSSAVATIVIYLFSPLIIGISGWKLVFLVSATMALAAAVVWLALSKRLLASVDFCPRPAEPQGAPSGNPDRMLWKVLPIVLVSIAIQGMLRDGISTWMPTFMSETFQVESTVSILTGVALPIMHTLVSLTNYQVLRAMKMDVFKTIVLYFSVVLVFLVGLQVFGMNSMMASMLLLALVNGAVHGINGIQTCYLPASFKNTGNVSFLAGLLNSATYVGSALSTYLFAVISENWGWGSTVTSWIIFAAAGLGLTLICMGILKKK